LTSGDNEAKLLRAKLEVQKMASIFKRPNGHGWVQFTSGDGKRQTIRLGKTPVKVAEAVDLRVEILLAARIAGVPGHGEKSRQRKK